MENIIVAATNFVGIPGLLNYFNHKQYFEAFIVGMSMASSTVYHLVENTKHPLPGMLSYPVHSQFNKNLNLWFLNTDRFFALSAILFTGDLKAILHDRFLQALIVLGLICLLFSENLPTQPKYNWLFVILHSIWHVCVWMTCNLISRSTHQTTLFSWLKKLVLG